MKFYLFRLVIAVLLTLSIPSPAPAQETAQAKFTWSESAPGLETGIYFFKHSVIGLRPQVLLFRVSLKHFSLHAVAASPDLVRTDVRSLTQSIQGFLGINANYFDVAKNPLGLAIEQSRVVNRLHRGGALLNGVLFIQNNALHITSREELPEHGITFAVQAGPRLIAKGKQLELGQGSRPAARSGAAVTKAGDLILFITSMPFPGVTLKDLQDMLLSPELGKIDSAINFDGGGSSQLYRAATSEPELFIRGRDPVPIALVVKRRTNHDRK